MYELVPSQANDHCANLVDLKAKLIHQAGRGAFDEGDDLAAGSSRLVKAGVIGVPRLVVVMAQKLRGDCGAFGFEQDLCFDQAGGAAIAISEWMDPCEV